MSGLWSSSAGAEPPVVQSGPSYDYYLDEQGNSGEVRFYFSSFTGDYLFMGCNDGVVLAGAGTVSTSGCNLTLSHSASDRIVSVQWDTCEQFGQATVQYLTNGKTYSVSNRVFSGDLTPPQVTVTSPNGGQTIYTGSIVTITWTASDNVGITSQNVYLSTNGGSTYTSIAGNLGGSVRQYTWTVPAMASTTSARIRVLARDLACNLGQDNSDANSTITTDTTPPPVTVTTPNGGETLLAGSSYVIAWTASDNVAITSQDVLLSTDGGATFSPFVTGLAGSARQYSWTVSNIVFNQTCRIKVVARDAAGNSGSDISNANFTISDDLTPPQVAVTSPNGGETVDAGALYTITWVATDNKEVASQDILYSTNGGTSFSTAASGLSGSTSQFSWIAPGIANNQAMRIRVVARDANANVGSDDGDANFTLWNPLALYPNLAEAPLFIFSAGFKSTVYLKNTSSNSVSAELTFHKPAGNAAAVLPVRLTLPPEQTVTYDVQSGFLPLSSTSDSIKGSVRLRHNGSSRADVEAMIAVDGGDQRSFTTPFIYRTEVPAGNEGPGKLIYSPLFYLGNGATALLAVQNYADSPAQIDVTLIYGTGEAGTASGSHALPRMTLAPQQNSIINLVNYQDDLQGAVWGSIEVSDPSNSVVAHTVMLRSSPSIAFDSGFVIPALYTATRRVVMPLKLDYDTQHSAYVMVVNRSVSETHAITASFKTDNGISISNQQFTLGPRQEKLIVLSVTQLLSAGQSTVADARLSFSGSAQDIVAGGVSMSPVDSRALSSRDIEIFPNIGRRLTAPFVMIDARNAGFIQLTNLGGTPVNFGAKVSFENNALQGVNSQPATVPPNGVMTLYLDVNQMLNNGTELTRASVEVWHTGDPASVRGCVGVLGRNGATDLAFSYPLEGVTQIPPEAVQTFPNTMPVEIGGSTGVVVIFGDGVSGTPEVTTTGGTLTPAGSDPFSDTYTFTPEDPDEPDTITITVTSAVSSTTTEIEVQKVKLVGFDTATEGRLDPDGGTPFAVRCKNNGADFPDGTLVVGFKGANNREVTTPVAKTGPKQVQGNAPTNTVFIKDAEIRVYLNVSGELKKISKRTLCDEDGCSAYYAFAKPGLATAVRADNLPGSPDGYNRLGGIATITAQAGGYRRFVSSVGEPPVNPTVNIGSIDFEVNTVTPTQLNGLVLRAPKDVEACGSCGGGQIPCKNIKVKNPGGKSKDVVVSAIPLYNLKPGPAPIPESRFPDGGPSIGGTTILIRGQNLDFVKSVTIGGTPAVIIPETQTDNRLVITALPHSAGANNAITLFDVDCAAPGGTVVPGGGYRYDVSRVTEFPGRIYVVGPLEGVFKDDGPTVVGGTADVACIKGLDVKVNTHGRPAGTLQGVLAFTADGEFSDCDCTCSQPAPPGTCPRDVSKDVRFRLANTAAPNDQRLKLPVERKISVHIAPTHTGCNKSF
ncbi:MAG TPA: Ig-like domain-containing protein [Blastocatellia bacterium]|nr:Ig-like domain-containing protein [Blastocatellia bacterium]